MTLADVDVETVQVRPARRSSDKAARDYLIASGATAISVIENETGCAFRFGTKIDPQAVSVHWISATQAPSIVKQARHDAGKSPDIVAATAALHRAAADHRVILTALTLRSSARETRPQSSTDTWNRFEAPAR